MEIDSAVFSVNGTSLESTTCAEKLKAPAFVGVPEMTPVPASKVRPGGREPIVVKVRGAVPPVAFSVVVYGVPTVPEGGVPKIAGSGFTVMLTTLELAVPSIAAVTVNFICEVIPAGAV